MITHESNRGTQNLNLSVLCNDFVAIWSVARYMNTTSVSKTNHIFQPKTPLAFKHVILAIQLKIYIKKICY
jgi:hypothetical protein